MRDDEMLLERSLTRSIVGTFFEVHRTLGFGLLESAYSAALAYELTTRGHRVAREVVTIVQYKGIPIARQRLDLVVDDKVIVEVKATELLSRASRRQLLSYLTATRYEVGLLLHFGVDAKFHRLIKSNQQAVSA